MWICVYFLVLPGCETAVKPWPVCSPGLYGSRALESSVTARKVLPVSLASLILVAEQVHCLTPGIWQGVCPICTLRKTRRKSQNSAKLNPAPWAFIYHSDATSLGIPHATQSRAFGSPRSRLPDSGQWPDRWIWSGQWSGRCRGRVSHNSSTIQ